MDAEAAEVRRGEREGKARCEEAVGSCRCGVMRRNTAETPGGRGRRALPVGCVGWFATRGFSHVTSGDGSMLQCQLPSHPYVDGYLYAFGKKRNVFQFFVFYQGRS